VFEIAHDGIRASPAIARQARRALGCPLFGAKDMDMAKSKKKTGKKKVAKKAAPAKARRAVKKSKAPAKRKAPVKKAKTIKKAKSVKKAKTVAKRKKTKRVRPPTFEQLMPAGEPLFVAPLDQV
jgi:hypothetical protein